MALWDRSTLRRVRGCGRSVRSCDGVAVKATGAGDTRSAGFAGLSTCGSVWACPTCAAKITGVRSVEVRDALAAWHASGGRVGLVTLTMRHRWGQPLAQLWSNLAYAWHRVASGRAWAREQAEHGVLMARTVRTGARAGQVVHEDRIGTIRLVETTVGPAGWHVHVHVLVLLRAGSTREDVANLGAQMFTRWRQALGDRGMPLPTWEAGVDARRLDGDRLAEDLGDYFAKANYSAAMEVTRSDLKRARGANVTPFGVLAFLTTGELPGAVDPDWLGQHADALWSEWEKGSRGRRQVTWSQGLREHLALMVERSDEEIAEEDLGGEVLVRVPAPLWRAVVARRLHCLVLEAAERDDDGTAVRAFLAGVAPLERAPVPRQRAGPGRAPLV